MREGGREGGREAGREGGREEEGLGPHHVCILCGACYLCSHGASYSRVAGLVTTWTGFAKVVEVHSTYALTLTLSLTSTAWNFVGIDIQYGFGVDCLPLCETRSIMVDFFKAYI